MLENAARRRHVLPWVEKKVEGSGFDLREVRHLKG
uniref:Uncharacterized protein n=1 Tax=Setaria italica TaxID=4555 RepID=K3XUC0_SETIT